MSDFDRTIEKAISELALAKLLGKPHAHDALKQAAHHVNLVLHDTPPPSENRAQQSGGSVGPIKLLYYRGQNDG